MRADRPKTAYSAPFRFCALPENADCPAKISRHDGPTGSNARLQAGGGARQCYDGSGGIKSIAPIVSRQVHQLEIQLGAQMLNLRCIFIHIQMILQAALFGSSQEYKGQQQHR
ncbi:MAG: hypothetical protein H7240_07355 [Glaciimonas sp.]|nr:hypothetical protein [Glaciimonas sp.]